MVTYISLPFHIFYLIFITANILLLWKRNLFNIFSPFVLPQIIFAIYYVLPSLLWVWLLGSDVSFLGVNLHLIGICCFFIGAIIASISRPNKKLVTWLDNHHHLALLSVIVFFFMGVAILLCYGLISGVTLGFISGANVEDLRRTGEIGKGFLKEPGIFFVSFSSTLIGAKYFQKFKRIVPIAFFAILFTIFIIFITTAHKAVTLIPLLIVLGTYSKYKNLSLTKFIIIVIAIIMFVGLLNFIRSGFKAKAESALVNRSILHFGLIYRNNYVPIIDMVEGEKLELLYGKEYLDNALIIIPRFLYPQKPIDIGYFLKEKLGLEFEGGGVPATPIGSLFLNFRLPGVIIGMFIIGLIYCYVYNNIFLITDSPEVAVLSMYILYFLLNPSLFMAQIEMLIIFCIFIFMCHHILLGASKAVRKNYSC